MVSLIAGGTGFIGQHLAKLLSDLGHVVWCVDRQPFQFDLKQGNYWKADLTSCQHTEDAIRAIAPDHIYQLAADMGGIGYLDQHDLQMMSVNSTINCNFVRAIRSLGWSGKLLFTSSACVYPEQLRHPLVEEDAGNILSVEGYGAEKLASEKMYGYLGRQGVQVGIVRLHNIYGPNGHYKGGREKSPAALCRKVAEAPNGEYIEVWGDGRQQRTYCYVGDAVKAIARCCELGGGPYNVGSEELVSIQELARIVIGTSGKELSIRCVKGPVGVPCRGCCADKIRRDLGWEASTALHDGLTIQYRWIDGQLKGVT